MTFPEAIQSGFRNYATFRGRASRSEFWYWTSLSTVVQVLAVAGNNPVAHGVVRALAGFAGLLLLAMGLPSTAVLVRRLHDTGRSGSWVFTWLGIFVVAYTGTVMLAVLVTAEMSASPDAGGAAGFLVMILAFPAFFAYPAYVLAQRGEAGANRFGPPPGEPPAEPAAPST